VKLLPLALVPLLVFGGLRLVEPSSWTLLGAVRAVGPVGGWRCVSSGTYVYDPGRERPDAALLSDPPEAVVQQQAPEVEIDSVEADLRGGDTVVWTHDANSDVSEGRRVFVLSPGRLQAVTVDLGAAHGTICNSHLGAWKIIAEQNLS
jgi:hypothetical protein